MIWQRADIDALVQFDQSIGQVGAMGISGRFFQGFGSVRGQSLVFRSRSVSSVPVLILVPFWSFMFGSWSCSGSGASILILF